MASDVERLKQQALVVSEDDRAQLDSLLSVLSVEDDGVAEALRRDAELDNHLERAISFEQLDIFIRSRFGG